MPPTYVPSVARNNHLEVQTMEELDVEALIDSDGNVNDLVIKPEEEAEINDDELLENMVSLACASLFSENFR